jgi:hypothetical protein
MDSQDIDGNHDEEMVENDFEERNAWSFRLVHSTRLFHFP